MKKVLLSLLLLLSVAVTSATAQMNQPQIGLRVGGNLAQLRGESSFGDDATDRKLGFTVGTFAEMPLTGSFSLQPELLYTQKGGTEEDVDFNLDYLELPVLVKYNLPVEGRLVPSLYAGPYAAYTLRRSFKSEGVSIDADEFFKSVDYGATFGVDFGYRFARRAATLGLRYDLGLANIFDDDFEFDDDDFGDDLSDAKLRTHELSVVLGVTLF